MAIRSVDGANARSSIPHQSAFPEAPLLQANAAIDPLAQNQDVAALIAAALLAGGGVKAIAPILAAGGQTVAAFLGTTGATTLLAPVVVGAAAFAKGYQLGNSEKVRIRRMIASLQRIDKSNMTDEQKLPAMVTVLKNASSGQNQAPASDPGGAVAASRRVKPLQESIAEAKGDLEKSKQLLMSKLATTLIRIRLTRRQRACVCWRISRGWLTATHSPSPSRSHPDNYHPKSKQPLTWPLIKRQEATTRR
jgi:hypothetical protein